MAKSSVPQPPSFTDRFMHAFIYAPPAAREQALLALLAFLATGQKQPAPPAAAADQERCDRIAAELLADIEF